MKKFSIVLLGAILMLGWIVYTPGQTEAASKFTDVEKIKTTDSELYTAITQLYEDGIVFSDSATLYKSGTKSTRGEVAQMIVNARGWQNETPQYNGFTDIKSSKYANAIRILADKGIVNKAATFKPTGLITRAQIAKMLVISFELEEVTSIKTDFADVNKLGTKQNDTKRYIQSLVNYGITKGYTEKKVLNFKPNNNVTRGQMALFLYRSIETQNEFEVIGIE